MSLTLEFQENVAVLTHDDGKRNVFSPDSWKISAMVIPLLASISSSRSMKVQPSFSASSLPTVLLPAPMSPMR